MSDAPGPAWIPILASATSVVIAVVTAVFAQRAAQSASQNADALEALKARLQDETAEKNAFRDYRYDALKHLYEEVQPLLFQLRGPLQQMVDHTQNLARAARSGDLDPGPDNWIQDPYYRRATIHRLMSPIAYYLLMQRRLNLFDVSLDARVAVVLSLLSDYAMVWRSDFTFAETIYGAGAYKPFPKRPSLDPQGVDARQGLNAGERDAIAEILIVEPPHGADTPPARVMRFGEFDALMSGRRPPHAALEPLTDALDGLPPQRRPVFWSLILGASLIADVARRTLDAAEIDLAAAGAAATSEARKADLACAGAVDDKIWTAAKKQLDATLAKASAELAVHRAKAKS